MNCRVVRIKHPVKYRRDIGGWPLDSYLLPGLVALDYLRHVCARRRVEYEGHRRARGQL